MFPAFGKQVKNDGKFCRDSEKVVRNRIPAMIWRGRNGLGIFLLLRIHAALHGRAAALAALFLRWRSPKHAAFLSGK